MSQKAKKKSIWHSCPECHSTFSAKDLSLHGKSCPPPEKNWKYSYVRQKTLYTSLEEFSGTEDAMQTFPKEERDQILLVSREVLRLCRWNVGDPVIVTLKGRPSIKTVWPFKGKSLMGASMIKETIGKMWGVQKGEVTLRLVPSHQPSAKLVVVSLKTSKLDREVSVDLITSLLRSLYTGKFLFTGTKIWLPYYGKKLLVSVKSVVPNAADWEETTLESNIAEIPDVSYTSEKSSPGSEIYSSTPKRTPRPFSGSLLLDRKISRGDSSFSESIETNLAPQSTSMVELSNELSVNEMEEDVSNISLSSDEKPDILSSLCTITEETEFLVEVEQSKDETLSKHASICEDIILFGLKDLTTKLSLIVSQAVDSSKTTFHLRKQRGILLHGPSGTGKTQLARRLAKDLNISLHEMQSADMYSKFIGETENRIKEFFDKARSNSPALIVLDKIDWLTAPNLKNSGATDLGRRAIETLALNLDRLRINEDAVAVLATASSLDSVDSVLRRSGRLECEEEMPLPDPKVRLEILNAMVSGTPHSLGNGDVESIANCTHGFVGGDLLSLGSHALLHMSKTSHSELSFEDFTWALGRVNPSAMKEVQVDIPNVRWTDIAGQESLKLKLRQSVEWPLTHPEAFVRLGIRPPRGILMYGPPGCSKTMIAKAVATESKLNFISIKGSELFSKWVGESERAVRDVFRRARQVAPSIVFFDELDAIGGERFTNGGGTRNVESRVLTQLLTEMDGVEDLEKVIVVGATNRPDRIDKALLRPGRMDNIVYVPLPDDVTRQEIFRRQFRKTPVSFTNFDDLVTRTAGYSGAEVVAVCHEAGRRALAEDINAEVVREEHFKSALEEIKPRTPPSLLKLYEDYQKLRM